MAIETTTRPMPDRHAPSMAAGQALEAERDQDQGERHEVVAEPVAELDPALAEVHEVERGRPATIARTAPVTSRLRPKRPITASPSRNAGLVSSRLMPTSEGTASGQATSNRPRVAPGSVQTGVS